MTETTFIRDAETDELLGISDLPEEARVKGTMLRGLYDALGLEEDYVIVDVDDKTVYVDSLHGEKE